jgi:hypothetical protein
VLASWAQRPCLVARDPRRAPSRRPIQTNHGRPLVWRCCTPEQRRRLERAAPFIASLGKLARRGSRLGARLLRRRSVTKSVSPRSSSARRVARSEFDCFARWRSLCADRFLRRAYFVIAHRRNACRLAPPQLGAWPDPNLIASLASARCVQWLAPLAAMFAGEPPSSSDPTKRVCLGNQLGFDAFRRLLLQIGGANIAGADRALGRDPV